MKKNIYLSLLLIIGLSLFSCEDYLDKSPELDIVEKDVFSDFVSFQGYLEDAYQCIVDETLGLWAEANWNFGDEMITTHESMLNYNFDSGNYWQWEIPNQSVFSGWQGNPSNAAKGNKGYWESGWFGIRLANNSLLHLDDLVSPSQEERDLIEGQALFFRGYFHFEILRSWGGIAYIDTVFSPQDVIREPRLSYLETAMRINDDLKKAAELLPHNWDQTTPGRTNPGANKGRITKSAALGYQGKNLLYAASPLMNGVETGNYTYNVELCKQAADIFNELIKIAPQGDIYLEPWEDYYKNFYAANGEVVNGQEIIFNNPHYMDKRWDYGDFNLTFLDGWGNYSSPTQNYIEYFGMENGLDIKQPDSGFDPKNPWKNRDPRFYYNIIVDGDRLIKGNYAGWEEDTYAQFYSGGRHRNNQNIITGYGYKKYKDITFNGADDGWGNGYAYECPQMRLADIYLMYAEAVNEGYGPNGAAPGGPTAAEAINVVRNRAGLPNVDNRYLSSKETFREFIRKERAVELAFESHRWHDIRRWYIANLPQYTEKYVLEFDREHTYFNKVLYLTRVFEPKHWWLPLPVSQVNLYPEFTQNPGW